MHINKTRNISSHLFLISLERILLSFKLWNFTLPMSTKWPKDGTHTYFFHGQWTDPLTVTLEKEKGLGLDPVPWCHACPSGMFSNGFLSGQACRTEVSWLELSNYLKAWPSDTLIYKSNVFNHAYQVMLLVAETVVQVDHVFVYLMFSMQFYKNLSTCLDDVVWKSEDDMQEMK